MQPQLGLRRRIGPGRLSAKETESLSDRLLDAAFACFAECGYGDATMEQIANRAGASTRTLYSRFNSKAALLEAVARRNAHRIVADHFRSFAVTPEGTEPRVYLCEFGFHIGAHSLMDETAGLIRVTFAEAHRFPVLARLYSELTQRAVTTIAEALRVWRAQGQVDFDDDAEHLAALSFI